MVAGGFSDSSVRLWDLKKTAKDKEKEKVLNYYYYCYNYNYNYSLHITHYSLFIILFLARNKLENANYERDQIIDD